MVISETIDRRKEIDVKIQTACERFSERMHDNFELLDGNLQHLRNQQLNCSNEITLELGKITCAQTELSENTKKKINEIENLCLNFLTKSSSIEEIFSNSLKEFNSGHQSALSLVLEEIRQKEQKFQHDIKENLGFLEIFNEQQKSALDCMRQRLMERFTFNNTQQQKHIEQMNSTMHEIKQNSLENLQELQQITNSLNEESFLTEEEERLIEENIQNLKALQQNLLKKKKIKKQVSENISNLDSLQNIIMNTASNTFELNNKYLNNQATELQNSCALVEKDISQAELSIDKSVAKCTTIKTQVDNMVQETFGQTQQISTDHAKYLEDLNCKAKGNDSERKALRLANCEQIKANKENISVSVENFKKSINENIYALNNTNLSLQSSLENYTQLFNKQLMNCERDIEVFKQSECKTYKATGATPKKKEFKYPRVLVETSPHNAIVKRFRQENNWSDLDTTLPIDEESDCEVEDATISIRGLSANESVLNSTPNL